MCIWGVNNMHEEIIKMFKKGIPRQKKLYQVYIQENKFQNFSYANFKSNNVMIMQIKDYLMTLDEYYHVSQSQIDNMCEYLKQNTAMDSFTKLKKIYKHLDDLIDYLNERYQSNNSLHGEKSVANCYYLIEKLEQLKIDIAAKKGYSVLELEKTISFENVIKNLLNPKEYVFDEHKLLYFIEKFSFIINHDRNNNDFNDNFCRAIERAKINIERDKLNYYKSMYNYISTIKELHLDVDYINDLLEISYTNLEYNLIDRKINSMRVDPKTGRRVVENYVISIDNDVTKKIDDAFSIEKISDSYLLGIHIADVYSLGYFEDESMDPRGNINKKDASLTKNKRRNAMSIYVLIDNNGIVRNYRIVNTVLKNNANLVYDDVARLIINDGVNPELKNLVVNLLSVYNMLENSKFPSNPRVSNFAYLITSKLMILCCTLYSEELKNNGLGIYMCGDSKNNVYSLTPDEYYTGFDDYNTYTKITSPIYDQSSLMNQFLVNRYLIENHDLDDEEKKQLVKTLKPVVDKLNKNK